MSAACRPYRYGEASRPRQSDRHRHCMASFNRLAGRKAIYLLACILITDVTMTVDIQATVRYGHDRSAIAYRQSGPNVVPPPITPLAEQSDSTSALR